MEIRDGEDRETDNPAPDIYCRLQMPKDAELVQRLEARFSDLYGKTVKITEVPLDSLILSPDDLRGINSKPDCYTPERPWSRVIWDVSAVAWLVDWEGRMVQDTLVPAPIPEYDDHYSHSFRRHPIRQAWSIDRDAVFDDLFTRLRQEG